MIKRWIIVKKTEFNNPEAHSWLYETKEEAVKCSNDWDASISLEYVEISIPNNMKGEFYDF